MIFFRWPRHRALRPHRRRTEVGGEHHDRRPREDDELGRVSPARGHVRVHGLPRGYVSFENSGTFSLVNFLNILTKILKIRKIDPISELPRRRGLLKVSKPFYLAEEISICLIRVNSADSFYTDHFPLSLAETFPETVSTEVIGQSYEGRDMRVIKICGGGECGKKPGMYIEGGEEF